MTIWMITREFEYTGGGGNTFYEEHIDEDFGYFTAQVLAEDKLADLVDEEKDAHRRNWQRTTHKNWELRKDHHDRVTSQNNILYGHGVAKESLIPVPHLYDEPVYPGWKAEYSRYNIIAIEEGAV